MHVFMYILYIHVQTGCNTKFKVGQVCLFYFCPGFLKQSRLHVCPIESTQSFHRSWNSIGEGQNCGNCVNRTCFSCDSSFTGRPGWFLPSATVHLIRTLSPKMASWVELALQPGSWPSLASHTLRRERKGLVTLQPSSCPHDKILLWPIRSVLFVDHIRCHGVQLRHNVFSGCQYLITKLLCSIVAFLGDNSVVAAWPDPSFFCEGCGLRD